MWPALSPLTELLDRIEARAIVREADRLRTDLVALAWDLRVLPPLRSNQSVAPQRTGEFAVALSAENRAARLESTEAANTDRTAFGPTNPPWAGLSSSNIAVSGFYGGEQGTDTLTGTVTGTGVRGSSSAEVTVTDSSDTTVAVLTIAATDPLETSYSLNNGLALTFDSGVFVSGDTFTIDVRDDLNFAIDPDRAFDGSGGDPGLARGQSIVDGSFELNGTTIAVNASDSLNSVIARINGSLADITASYSETTERLTLTRNTAANESITADNDSSGFLAALKLDTAVAVPGQVSEYDQAIDQVAALSGVQSGTLLINGTGIDIDIGTDTLNDLLARINQQGALSLSQLANGRFRLRGNGLSELTVDSNGTGFFEALGLGSETLSASSAAPTLSGVFTGDLIRRTERLFEALNDLFRSRIQDRFDPEAAARRERVLGAFREEATALVQTRFVEPLAAVGIRTGVDQPSSGRELFGALRSQALERAFSQRPAETLAVFGNAAGPEGGLIAALIEALDTTTLARRVPGSLVDLRI